MDDTKKLRVVFTGDTASLDEAFGAVRVEADLTKHSLNEIGSGSAFSDLDRGAKDSIKDFEDIDRSSKDAFRDVGQEAENVASDVADMGSKSSGVFSSMGSSLTMGGGQWATLALAVAGVMATVAALGVIAAVTFAVVGLGLVAITGGIMALALYGSTSSKSLKADFTNAFKSIKAEFDAGVAPLMPEMKKIVSDVSSGVKTALQNFIPAINNLLNTMLPVIDTLAKGLGGFGSFMAQQTNMVVNAFASVKGYFTGPMMQGLRVLINGFDTLIADLIKIGAPIIGPLLTILGKLLETLGARFLSIFESNTRAIINITLGFVKLLSWIVLLIPDIIQLGIWLYNGAKIIIGAVTPAFEALINTVVKFWDKNKNWLIPVLKDLGVLLAGALVIALNLVFDAVNLVINVIQVLINIIIDIGKWIGTAIYWFEQLWGKITATFGSIVSAVSAGVGGVYNAFISPFEAAWQFIKRIVSDIKNAVGSVVGEVKKLPGQAGGAVSSVWSDITGLFASGTNYAPGGVAVVGEQGPELVNLPRGSQVIPNQETNQMLGGGQTINLTVNAGTVVGANGMQELANTIYRTLQQTARANGFNGALPQIGVAPLG